MSVYRLGLLCLTVLLFAVAVPAFAQTPAQPINVGENLLGEITAEQPTHTFVLTSEGGSIASVQVFGTTTGFAPALRILDPTGGIAQSVVNPQLESTIATTIALTQSGTYLLEVSSVNGGGGQFLITVQGSAAVAPEPVALIVGQPIPDTVNATTPVRSYTFSADATQARTLIVTSDYPAGGPSVTLLDDETGETVGTGSTRLIETQFSVPGGYGFYRVEIAHSGSPFDETYTVLLVQGEGEATAQPTQQITTLPQSGPCVVASLDGERINVRSAPSIDAAVLTRLEGNQFASVIGRLADNSWYQVNVNGVTGWIAAFVVTAGGSECGSVPVIAAPQQPAQPAQPAQPTEAPTQPVQPPAETPEPTAEPSGPPDLTITGVNVSVDATEGTTITVTVANIGTGIAASNELHVQFPNSDIQQRVIPALNPGQSMTFTFENADSTMGGDWQANVDAIGTVDESNDVNNHASGTV